MNNISSVQNQVPPPHLAMRVAFTENGPVLKLRRMTITLDNSGRVHMISWSAVDGSGMAPSERLGAVLSIHRASQWYNQQPIKTLRKQCRSAYSAARLEYIARLYNAHLAANMATPAVTGA